MEEKSFYEILGVDQAASQQEIRSAFQARAFELHPDSRDGRDDTPVDAKEAFQKVVEAYHVLRDPQRRKKYDVARRHTSRKTIWDVHVDEDEDIVWKHKRETVDEWFEKASRGFREYARDAERLRRERDKATWKSHHEAWMEEKKEAVKVKERFERSIYKSSIARDMRRLQTIKKFWHSHRGILWQDVVIGGVLLTLTGGALYEGMGLVNSR
jgi:DnaJ-class molecular chaperone